MPYKNKKKQHDAWKKWYSKPENRTEHIRTSKINQQKYVEWFREYKKQFKCAKCGEDEPVCIDFHHPEGKNGTEETIAIMVHNGLAKERVKKAISECIPLCSNCHRKVHKAS